MFISTKLIFLLCIVWRKWCEQNIMVHCRWLYIVVMVFKYYFSFNFEYVLMRRAGTIKILTYYSITVLIVTVNQHISFLFHHHHHHHCHCRCQVPCQLTLAIISPHKCSLHYISTSAAICPTHISNVQYLLSVPSSIVYFR